MLSRGLFFSRVRACVRACVLACLRLLACLLSPPQRGVAVGAVAVDMPATQLGERKNREADLRVHLAGPRRAMEDGQEGLLGGIRNVKQGEWRGQG